MPKTIGNRKGDCAWSYSRGQTQPEKSANCKTQVSTMWPVHDTDLCVAICRFSQVVFATSKNFTHNILFYFQYFLVLSFCLLRCAVMCFRGSRSRRTTALDNVPSLACSAARVNFAAWVCLFHFVRSTSCLVCLPSFLLSLRLVPLFCFVIFFILMYSCNRWLRRVYMCRLVSLRSVNFVQGLGSDSEKLLLEWTSFSVAFPTTCIQTRGKRDSNLSGSTSQREESGKAQSSVLAIKLSQFVWVEAWVFLDFN